MQPGSKAEHLVLSFPAAAEYYNKAISQPIQHFRRENLLVQIYLRDLLNLVMKNDTTGRANVDLPRLYDELEGKIGAWKVSDELMKIALLDIEVYEATGTVCADTGASQSVGGELMFNFLQKRCQKFIEINLAVCLADGQQSTLTVLKTTVPITVHGRTFRTDLIFLPHAKGNRTLLGVDFLRQSGIVMDMHNNICDVPSRAAGELRTEQLKELELKKIIDCFEDINKSVDFANWTERGYVLNQGVLYRYSPHSEVEEAQLVVPSHEREKIFKLHHNSPTASHYGALGTFSRISSRYYWTGMRKYIADYVKNCAECIRYKATSQQAAGLLQTPVPAQRFESIAIDLFGPLPETSEGMKWSFIIEDYTTKWV
ncbi:hypothetical protein AVEN_53672-1 [Araneus ventricosus]|uniref:Integrase zinc-binding domain-containing protein n=1 Tax=Araneus ventricosus TaxID=182803 RepID=A0A4Y2P1H7_ARAVE|nr:hypothetical protein AVEN_53672-1 [Araneus ventricosus]